MAVHCLHYFFELVLLLGCHARSATSATPVYDYYRSCKTRLLRCFLVTCTHSLLLFNGQLFKIAHFFVEHFHTHVFLKQLGVSFCQLSHSG